MNKRILQTIVLLIISTGVFSQRNVRFTVFVNPTVNWLQSMGKNASSDGAAIGVDAGLTSDFFFAERYAFSTGMSIGSFGGRLRFNNSVNFKDIGTVPPSTIKYRLQYLTVPFGLKFKTIQIGYNTFFAQLGFTTQFNVKAVGYSNDSRQLLNGDNISDEIHFFNLGYHFGIGTEYSIGGNTAVVLGLTYTNGFTGITTNTSDKITLAGIAIRLGILF